MLSFRTASFVPCLQRSLVPDCWGRAVLFMKEVLAGTAIGGTDWGKGWENTEESRLAFLDSVERCRTAGEYLDHTHLVRLA